MAKKQGSAFFILVGVIIFIIFITFQILKSGRSNKKESHVENDMTTEVDSDTWPPGLGEENVELEENLLKKNYYIVFDGSGSMDGDKLIIAKKALKEFIKNITGDVNIGLTVFDGMGVSERVKLGANKNLLLDKIDKVIANSGTPLHKAIKLAYNKIIDQGRKQLGYGNYDLVIVTDGEASDGQDPGAIVDVILEESPVIIHTIGFQIGDNHSLNQPGRILYKSANNFEELSSGLEDVLAELEDFDVSEFEE